MARYWQMPRTGIGVSDLPLTIQNGRTSYTWRSLADLMDGLQRKGEERCGVRVPPECEHYHDMGYSCSLALGHHGPHKAYPSDEIGTVAPAAVWLDAEAVPVFTSTAEAQAWLDAREAS